MSMFRGSGPRTRRLRAYLQRRTRTRPERRPPLDTDALPRLFRKEAVVFTDTADFTLRTARDGILHFLMVFDTVTAIARRIVKRTGGELVKVEVDAALPAALLARVAPYRIATFGRQAIPVQKLKLRGRAPRSALRRRA